jgi:hypothetical protein
MNEINTILLLAQPRSAMLLVIGKTSVIDALQSDILAAPSKLLRLMKPTTNAFGPKDQAFLTHQAHACSQIVDPAAVASKNRGPQIPWCYGRCWPVSMRAVHRRCERTRVTLIHLCPSILGASHEKLDQK